MSVSQKPVWKVTLMDTNLFPESERRSVAEISPHPPIPRYLRKISLTQDSNDRIGDWAGRETYRRDTVDLVQKRTISETDKKKKQKIK